MEWPSIIPVVIRSYHDNGVTSIHDTIHTQDQIDSPGIEIRAGSVGATFVRRLPSGCCWASQPPNSWVRPRRSAWG